MRRTTERVREIDDTPGAMVPPCPGEAAADLRAAAVRLIDVWDGNEPVQPAVNDLRAALLADKERRDTIAGCVADAAAEADAHFGIQTEHLADSPQWRARTVYQEKLFTARQFYAAVLAGRPAIIDSPPGKPMSQCYQHADQFVTGFDKFMRSPHDPLPHPQPAPTDLPAAVTLLLWIAEHGPMPADERPIGLSDTQTGNARWQLRKAGLVEYGPENQLGLTDLGRKVLGRQVGEVAAVGV